MSRKWIGIWTVALCMIFSVIAFAESGSVEKSSLDLMANPSSQSSGNPIQRMCVLKLSDITGLWECVGSSGTSGYLQFNPNGSCTLWNASTPEEAEAYTWTASGFSDVQIILYKEGGDPTVFHAVEVRNEWIIYPDGMSLLGFSRSKKDAAALLAESNAEPVQYEASLGETVSTDTVEVTLERFEFANYLDWGSGKNYYMPSKSGYITPPDGYLHGWFRMSIRNLTDEDLNLKDLRKYMPTVEYAGESYTTDKRYNVSDKDNDNFILKPGKTAVWHCNAYCDKEVVGDKTGTVVVRIPMPVSSGKAEAVYTIPGSDSGTVSAAATPEPASKMKTFGLKDTIKESFMELEIVKLEKLDELRFNKKDTGGISHFLTKNQANATYITLRCNWKNLLSTSLDLGNRLDGTVTIGDYSYRLQSYDPNIGDITAMQNSPVYLYALVPDEVAAQDLPITFTLEFNENMEENSELGKNEHDYCYTILAYTGNPATVQAAQAAAPTPTPSVPQGEAAAALYETLKSGSTGDAVTKAADKLVELGYLSKTSSKYGDTLKKAVRQFETDYDLAVDGELSPDDQAVLFAAAIPTTLSAPKNLKATAGKPSEVVGTVVYSPVSLSWKASADADSYEIYTSMDGVEYDFLTSTSDCAYTDHITGQRMAEAQKVYYRIKAVKPGMAMSGYTTTNVKIPAVIAEPEVKAEISSVAWKNGNYGVIRVYLGYTNLSKAETIDSLTMEVTLYDAYGNEINSGTCDVDEKSTAPGKSYKSGNTYWIFNGSSAVASAKAYITKVHTTSGQIYTYNEAQTGTTWTKQEGKK